MDKWLKPKVNYVNDAVAREKGRGFIINKGQVRWIMVRFIHYAALMLVHGFQVTIPNKLQFTLNYIDTLDIIAVEKESMYIKSSALSGTFFKIHCEGKIPDHYKAIFKPSISFRRLIEKYLDDPDLSYKLIR